VGSRCASLGLTYFIVVENVERARRFYANVLGSEVVMEGAPSIVALTNCSTIINVEGRPTDDKQVVTLEAPRDPDRASSFLNIRMADHRPIYADWSSQMAPTS
jgi:hypothetical protein